MGEEVDEPDHGGAAAISTTTGRMKIIIGRIIFGASFAAFSSSAMIDAWRSMRDNTRSACVIGVP